MAETFSGPLEERIRMMHGEVLLVCYNYTERMGIVMWRRNSHGPVPDEAEYIVHRFTLYPVTLIQGDYYPEDLSHIAEQMFLARAKLM
jgi:hypothetical protein